ncbi:MAG: phosphonoacetaldehyde hydrolase [Chloroflexi bacterium]|nr:phosphonoacetaldehyde hydrolase [Chloroflexota bacterium]MCY3936938.1 phosphonoacetaldehyde hydrolase [Chloroflexota bacterium]
MALNGDFVFNRSYRGRVKAAILDWSGTTADAYVLAPAVVFVDVFRKHGVEITMPEARGPMGLRKDLHIKALTEVPEIAERWEGVHGKRPGQAEVDAMFADFVPMQIACLREYTTLLPGVAETTQRLQAEGIKLGSTTGFVRPMVDILEADAKKQGYVPDASVAGDEVINGARPKPFMVYRNLDLLDVHPIQSVVKVDDTVTGVGEALEAGCWGVGIARYSNYMDIDSLEHAESLSEAEMQRRLAYTREILIKTGAHYVIDTLDELPAVIDDVNARLARGERP